MRSSLFFLLTCLAAAGVPFLPVGPQERAATEAFPGWPDHFEGRPLRPLALSERESRFSTATRGAETLRVREWIYDARGQAWTDVSAWYWAAFWGGTEGPWWTVTIAEKQTTGSAG